MKRDILGIEVLGEKKLGEQKCCHGKDHAGFRNVKKSWWLVHREYWEGIDERLKK